MCKDEISSIIIYKGEISIIMGKDEKPSIIMEKYEKSIIIDKMKHL